MTSPLPVPTIRISSLNQSTINPDGEYILYWMVAQRRLQWNFALQRAVEWSHKLQKPLLIFEPLRIAYQWASNRFHQFVIEGMRDHARIAKKYEVTYLPYVEPSSGMGHGLLSSLAEEACVIITDEYPCYFIPRMTNRAAHKVKVLMEQVDSNGLLPLRASGRVFTTAASFRRHLQKTLLPYFATEHFPMVDPLSASPYIKNAIIPTQVIQRWKPAMIDQLLTGGLSSLPIDHTVQATEEGGPEAALKRLDTFLDQKLYRYHSHRNALDNGSASGLSAHIHFGHISVHQIAKAVFESCQWSPDKVAPKPSGSREGWWGAPNYVESFIDELVTWRELGYAFCFHRPEEYDRYESLPSWALKTLEDHRHDQRPYLYRLDDLDSANTHDPVWNAAQRQLITEGRIHNYVRMLWGKKILEWSPTPEEALQVMIHLNNKYALDGRDPNSYSGIFWCLGRFDRAWGPERPIFGKIRFMSSDSTMRKLKAKKYVQRYQSETISDLFNH